MSAAVEAGIEGIKSIGFSLLDYNWDANFLPCEKHIEKITKLAIADKSENLVLNVNFPLELMNSKDKNM